MGKEGYKMSSENFGCRLSGAGYYTSPEGRSEGIVSIVHTECELKSNNSLRYFFNAADSPSYLMEADPNSLQIRCPSNGGLNKIDVIGSGNITFGNITGTCSFVAIVNDRGAGTDMFRIIIMSTIPALNCDSGPVNINAGDFNIEMCSGIKAAANTEAIVKINNRCVCSIQSVNENINGCVNNPDDILYRSCTKLSIHFCLACGRGIGGSNINYIVQPAGGPDFIFRADNLIGKMNVKCPAHENPDTIIITGKGNVSYGSMECTDTNFTLTITSGTKGSFQMVITSDCSNSAFAHDSGIIAINSGELVMGRCPWSYSYISNS
jgi:hypothetical protein